MILGAWCGQLGVGGWVLMGLFWATFVGLVLWALSRLFAPAEQNEVLHEGADDLDQRWEGDQLDLSEYRTRGGRLPGSALHEELTASTRHRNGRTRQRQRFRSYRRLLRSFIRGAGGSGRWIPARSRRWSR